ncbi:MAG: translesion error-prone DNA polymerase V autoproteolytic subunit [Candidatus Cloacimonetes bacterium]|nr:translesion error-prone DNA polymerase V autoproteolytic subunit [Candidatus Cloacimonadota bacterium]MCF7813636.1 translesion error-prone DNA polymerase V autoproteolytic subunit [Candidatus Cloacimonadota bacterium]MCF7868315.1 translesion error-prone DNA polymerase V autoproteolytic subunit [Candidatus Cloacimonadota bacterium]MCF7883789.1 translesion error-prone DNA polymerase V autoproteolytic subunit [Candidatus Cloacimonadota bacterium]
MNFQTDRIIFLSRFQQNTTLLRPLLGNRIPAGFPSPAQDYIEDTLDLNEFLVAHPSATYFVRVDGFSMTGAGIFSGDILIVDRSLEPAHKKIVIAIVDGELTVKRLWQEKNKWYLMPENSDYPKVEITKDMEFVIWGVVVYSLHKTV